ncbi:tetratricopeptide repeat protein [Methylobacterium sp. WL119]|uniref:tetratricopeptide repeat protein n=1 Tax=unclassified Methylobacterium TaxID=2615210 RepID=UPI0011C6F744|nr:MULTISPECIES: tetratricopeptide repeat protein [unclassified Methylobacterium]TXN39068.1 tetratricopeptide repeat protein [Methylobacterium sp. WL93]TXN47479.1 tetratricopeptide repeat protein [Methylobacterium sp. WL119]
MAPIARPLLFVLLATVSTAAAAAPPGNPDRHPAAAAEPKAQDRKPAASLNELYERLRNAEDDAEAKGVATLIERRLDRSGSATVDLLTDRARQAMTAQDFALAAELMDRATAIEPAWSEGWNRRATVFWLLTDRESAIADLQRALVLEPRHFEAWAALGRIYLSMDDKARAMNAYRRAIAIYPRMPKLKDAMERLSPEVDGRDL